MAGWTVGVLKVDEVREVGEVVAEAGLGLDGPGEDVAGRENAGRAGERQGGSQEALRGPRGSWSGPGPG